MGSKSLTLLNEPGIDVDAEPYRKLVRELADALRAHGVRFFAVALVADERRRISVSSVLPVPPFSWYREFADAVHEQLCAELGHAHPAATEEIR